jgi:hypothetical protein
MIFIPNVCEVAPPHTRGVSLVRAKEVRCKDKSLDVNLDKGSRQRIKVRCASNDEFVLAPRTFVLAPNVVSPHFAEQGGTFAL